MNGQLCSDSGIGMVWVAGVVQSQTVVGNGEVMTESIMSADGLGWAGTGHA